MYYAKKLYLNGELVEDLVIPNTVTEIKAYAFYSCNSLSSVNYLGTIEQWCGITFGNYYGANPLNYAKKLYLNGELVEDLVIPNTVTEIKAYAFEGCTSITSVNYLGTIEQWCGITFGSSSANPLCNGAKLYLNGELVEDLVIPNTVTEIKAYAFYNCDSITSVTIPDSVTSIGYEAFYNCDSLSTVYYNGTKEEWSGISGNSNLTGATRYYYSETEPTTSGNYWRYVEGVPTPW